MVECLKVRVFIVKLGLDGYDRGVKVIVRVFRDVGFEVIYIGIRQILEQIVESVIQEDVDVFGISIFFGVYMVLILKIFKFFEERGIKFNEDIFVFVGGIILFDDVEQFEKMGVVKVFGLGSLISEIIKFIDENVLKFKKFRENV